MAWSDRRWTALCKRCNLVIGVVDGGRFIHDPDCTQPLAIGRGTIGRGTLRCCRCSGSLSVVEEPTGSAAHSDADFDDLDEADFDLARSEAAVPTVFRLREARQRR